MRAIVNSREIAAEYRLSHWAQIMQERSESGMSIKAYCESIGLHQNVYHYWQRKLREVAITTNTIEEETKAGLIPQTPQGLVVPHSRNCSPMPPGWALCSTEKPKTGQETIQIEIGKSRVSADASTDYELLSKICRMLMSLC